MADKRLSEVLNIEELKSYGDRVCIVSGVGSGKNYWVENELTKYGNVLLVTSRKIVKDQTLEEEFFTEKSEWYGDSYKVCTHSAIGKFVKENTRPYESINETIFDYVVIDEAHALVSDATFSDDTNYLWQFIRNVKATVILMTGTVTWIKDLIEEAGFKIINKEDECINLRPKRIEIISHNKAKKILLEKSSINNKYIYMLPSANEAYRLEDDFINYNSRDDVVAITSSEREGIFADEGRKERQEYTYEMLVKENKLPDDVNIILTTTKLREGVNIKDGRIRNCISGCHSSVDIKQFAGRVRTGLETLYVVEDKKQNRNYVNVFDKNASSRLLEKFDEVIQEYIDDNWAFGEPPDYYAHIDDCKSFYTMIEKRFDLIKFNRYESKFEIFNQKIIGCEKEKKDMENFKNNTWLYLGNIFGKGVNISLKDKKSRKKAIKEKCKLFIEDYIGKPLNTEEREVLRKELTIIGLRTSKDEEYKSLGAMISHLGYKLEWHGNKNKGIKTIAQK